MSKISSSETLFHVIVSVIEGKRILRYHEPANVYYKNREEAIKDATELWNKRSDAAMIEVFESGVARPIWFFER